jgi:hypothetical protein
MISLFTFLHFVSKIFMYLMKFQHPTTVEMLRIKPAKRMDRPVNVKITVLIITYYRHHCQTQSRLCRSAQKHQTPQKQHTHRYLVHHLPNPEEAGWFCTETSDTSKTTHMGELHQVPHAICSILGSSPIVDVSTLITRTFPKTSLPEEAMKNTQKQQPFVFKHIQKIDVYPLFTKILSKIHLPGKVLWLCTKLPGQYFCHHGTSRMICMMFVHQNTCIGCCPSICHEMQWKIWPHLGLCVSVLSGGVLGLF